MSSPLTDDFDHIDTWVFDLDNTLYPPSCNLFALIDIRMGEFIQSFLNLDPVEARHIQKQYFNEYGTTLNGLMTEHGMSPEPYLEYVHNIDHSILQPDEQLAKAIQQLPGRKIVYTNGSAGHAANVLDKLALSHLMDGVHDIESSAFTPKPQWSSYASFVKQFNIQSEKTAMFEDIAVNLKIPAELGMRTVLVRADGDHPDEGWVHLGNGEEPYVHHLTDNLDNFLRNCLQTE